MTDPRYSYLVARIFARVGRSSPDVPQGNAHRLEEIRLIQKAMTATVVRRRVRFAVGASAAAVLAVAGTLAPGYLRSHQARLVAPEAPSLVVTASTDGDGTVVPPIGAPVLLAGETVLAPGSSLHVGSTAGAHLALSTGTRMAIHPNSDVTLREGGRSAIFNLTSGSLQADVAKLKQDERFVVRTVDSEVEVRGTSFRVSVVPLDESCGDGTTTRVAVYEGVVVVRRNGREERVAKGEEWPKGCASDALPSSGSPSVSSPTKVADPGRARKPSAPEASLLARENDDFAEAMLARRSSDKTSAVAALDRYLARHPTSHLAEDAYAERMELLSTVDRGRAIAAARQYLAKYPTGFARRTAEDILAKNP